MGYSPTQGLALGWEGGAGASFVSATLGTEVRPFGDRVAKFYVAGEPALAVPLPTSNASTQYPDRYVSAGASAGFSVDEHGTGYLAGGFIGVPWIRSGDCRDEWVPTASISVGVHVFVDAKTPEWTVYATPKLGTLGECPTAPRLFVSQ
jgi:hypothetical protein